MTRTEARRNAMKLIYEWEFGGSGNNETIEGLLQVQAGEPEYDFMLRLFSDVTEQYRTLDSVVEKYCRGWSLDRLSKMDLAILRIAICELQRGEEATNVVISEAVDMAEVYSTDKAGSFINGILGSYARDHSK